MKGSAGTSGRVGVGNLVEASDNKGINCKHCMSKNNLQVSCYLYVFFP